MKGFSLIHWKSENCGQDYRNSGATSLWIKALKNIGSLFTPDPHLNGIIVLSVLRVNYFIFEVCISY